MITEKQAAEIRRAIAAWAKRHIVVGTAVTVEGACGALHYSVDDGWMRAESTDGWTLTITVNGGAADIDV